MLPTARTFAEDASFEGQLADLLPAGYRLACGMLHDPTTAEDVVRWTGPTRSSTYRRVDLGKRGREGLDGAAVRYNCRQPNVCGGSKVQIPADKPGPLPSRLNQPYPGWPPCHGSAPFMGSRSGSTGQITLHPTSMRGMPSTKLGSSSKRCGFSAAGCRGVDSAWSEPRRVSTGMSYRLTGSELCAKRSWSRSTPSRRMSIR
jgi:hypothetical protein